MRTRAILQTSPFKTRDGEWTYVTFPDGEFLYRIRCKPKHADLKPGDTITVEKHGSEWRAV